MRKRRVERRLEEQARVKLNTGSYTVSMGLDSILHASMEIWVNVVRACVCACDITRFYLFIFYFFIFLLIVFLGKGGECTLEKHERTQLWGTASILVASLPLSKGRQSFGKVFWGQSVEDRVFIPDFVSINTVR